MNAPFAPNASATTTTANFPAPDETATRGRPSGYSERILEMLIGVVRECGVSDSAAAVHLGMGASTLSDWKRAHPEIRISLQQAREAFRAVQLRKIMAATQAEAGRGWRAAAWLLERVFPIDYAKTAQERSSHERREERLAEREERAEQEARLADLRARNLAATEAAEEEPVFAGREHEEGGEYEEGDEYEKAGEDEEGDEYEDSEEGDDEAGEPLQPSHTPRVFSENPFGNSGNSAPAAAHPAPR